MIIVDTALQKREAKGNPVKVAMTGAGYMGRGIALQIEKYVTGMQLVAISNRTLSQAKRAYKEAGIDTVNSSPVFSAESSAPLMFSDLQP